MKRVNFTTYIGLGLGLYFVISGMIESGHISLFWNFPSFLVIIGGTTGALILSYPLEHLKTLGSVMVRAFTNQKIDLKKDIQNIVEVSVLARKSGVLALEGVAKEYEDDAFFQKGIQMISDGFSREALTKNLKTEIFYMKKRHQIGIDMVDMIANSVTSLGLMGTYIGLIPMLNFLDNPSALGPLMSLELVSSFYGCFLSYVIFTPLVRKLKAMSAAEVLRNTLIMDGLSEVLEGKNPKLIEELLSASLTKKQMRKMMREADSEFNNERIA